VHDGFPDRREADEDVDDRRDRAHPEDHGYQVPTESYQEPVQSADDEQDKRYHM